MAPKRDKSLTFKTLVDILVTIGSRETGRASTRVRAVNDASVANRSGVARVRGTRVVQVTQEAGLAGRALAEVVGNPVVAGTSV